MLCDLFQNISYFKPRDSHLLTLPLTPPFTRSHGQHDVSQALSAPNMAARKRSSIAVYQTSAQRSHLLHLKHIYELNRKDPCYTEFEHC